MGPTILLVLLAAVLLTVSILTWGSVGSAVLIFCLIMMGCSLLYQKFLTNQDDDDFRTDL